MQPAKDRGTRTLTSQNMTTVFLKDTQDVERVDAQGDGKFNENDRNGVAANVSYVAADQTVKLRGGDPTGPADEAAAVVMPKRPRREAEGEGIGEGERDPCRCARLTVAVLTKWLGSRIDDRRA